MTLFPTDPVRYLFIIYTVVDMLLLFKINVKYKILRFEASKNLIFFTNLNVQINEMVGMGSSSMKRVKI